MLEVRTGCRLHFGLMEVAAGAPHRFAGLGLMLARPGFVLNFAESADSVGQTLENIIDEEIRHRMRAVVALRPSPPSCRIGLCDQLPLHSGLGGGTQLACAVALGLELLKRRSAGNECIDARNHTTVPQTSEGDWLPVSKLQLQLTPSWLVQNAARGLRSAVGLTGFLKGGLLLDEGYSEEPNSEQFHRSVTSTSRLLPANWRVVLVIPNRQERVHGRQEAKLIEELGSRPYRQSAHMLGLARRIFELASSEEEFVTFTETLDQYMELGARLFSPYQGGLYNGEEVSLAVQLARAAGLRGVGQSSWGPTVFGFAENEPQAFQSAQAVRDRRPDWCVTTTEPATSGAEARWLR